MKVFQRIVVIVLGYIVTAAAFAQQLPVNCEENVGAPITFTGAYLLDYNSGVPNGGQIYCDVTAEQVVTNATLPDVETLKAEGFVDENGKLAMKMFNYGSGWGFFDIEPSPSQITWEAADVNGSVIASNCIELGARAASNNECEIFSRDFNYATITVVWENEQPDSLTYTCDDFCLISPVGDPVGIVTDTDEDGVLDTDDLCPDTAAGDIADANGCSAAQLDDDGDGVSNADDLCPTEDASGYDNDSDGCIDDTDGDGVGDDVDACPAEDATGYDVDGDGCIDDTDGDGVLDPADGCGNTEAGALVDAMGCSGAQNVANACPTTDTYRTHGKYVSCVARASEAQVEAGLLTEEEKDAIVSEAGQTDIGKGEESSGKGKGKGKGK